MPDDEAPDALHAWFRQRGTPPPDISVFPLLPAELAEQLALVPPSHQGDLAYRPCSVTLRDGTVRDRVYVQEVTSWLAGWGVLPEDDDGKDELALVEVAAIAESPSRLPPGIADAIYADRESGMGYFAFTLLFADGSSLPYVTGDILDFLELPSAMTPKYIVGVRTRGSTPQEASLDGYGGALSFAWCLYRDA
jgi:hypothetical protein